MSQINTPRNPTSRILLASLVGTTIEFFDFYIYATAAVLVFPKLFFPSADPTSATLQSLATFALAFFARPLGAALFGHFGDRKGRKATLVAALMTMGPSTVAIGLLPTYATIGVAAPILLCLFRFGQGLGLGRWYGCFRPEVTTTPGAPCASLLMPNPFHHARGNRPDSAGASSPNPATVQGPEPLNSRFNLPSPRRRGPAATADRHAVPPWPGHRISPRPPASGRTCMTA